MRHGIDFRFSVCGRCGVRSLLSFITPKQHVKDAQNNATHKRKTVKNKDTLYYISYGQTGHLRHHRR